MDNLIKTYCKYSKNGENIICANSKCNALIGFPKKTRSNAIFNHVFTSCQYTKNLGQELESASIVFEEQFRSWMSSKNMTNPKVNRCKLEELLLKQQELASAEVAKDFWKGETIRIKVPRPVPAEPTAKCKFITTNRILNDLWSLVDLKAYEELLDIHAMLVVTTGDLKVEKTNPFLNDEDIRTRNELLQEENNLLKIQIKNLQCPAAETTIRKVRARLSSA